MKPSIHPFRFCLQCGLKLRGFARLFSVPPLLVGFLLPASAVELRPRNEKDFQKLQKMLESPLYWRKPSLWKSLEKERKITVSVLRVDREWSFKGAGLIEASRSFTLEKAKNFSRLKRIPEHFQDVEFGSSSGVLNLKVKFLGRERPLSLKFSEEKSEDESRIFFQSVGIWLQGLEGVLILKDHGRQQTEAGFVAGFDGDFHWLPDWMVSVGAEAVMHHVAESLRKSVENDYKIH